MTVRGGGSAMRAPLRRCWGGYARWRRRRLLRRDAGLLLRETRRLLRRYGHRLKETAGDRVLKAADALRQARDGDDLECFAERLGELDELLDKHLAFGRKSTLREYAESIGVAVLIALLLRAFVVEAFKIPSGSMIPTLRVGDHIFVSKFIYGVRVPWTHLKFFTASPARGEIIVFIFPGDESKDFIKRVVAVAGDTVELRLDGPFVNGLRVDGHVIERRPVDRACAYLDVEEGQASGETRECRAFIEQNDGQRHYVLKHVVDQGSAELPLEEYWADPRCRFRERLLRPFRVPEGHVFVMGDNRDNSQDGRCWGFLPLENIKGKALFIWWSRSTAEGIRWRRLFRPVHGLRRDEPLTIAAPPEEARAPQPPAGLLR
ncbi:MAG: signal peptidase I [Proteobacteria bacterium]|nr:signal peptidase I [Pseudomonadota bacterium]